MFATEKLGLAGHVILETRHDISQIVRMDALQPLFGMRHQLVFSVAEQTLPAR